MQLITSLAAFATAITSVNALGSAIINNNCAFPVYLWAVDAERNPSSPTTISAGGTYSEQYHVLSSGGVSLKLSTDTSNQYVTQFEYTVQAYDSQPFVWYDGSNVNCADAECPFWNYGINLKTSIASCPIRDCPIQQVCTGFYTLWNDDVNSLSCDDSADTIMTLCSATSGSSSQSAYSSQQQKGTTASSPSPSPAPTSSTKPPTINEAVLTTFTTYAVHSKRSEPIRRHGHLQYHQHAAAQE